MKFSPYAWSKADMVGGDLALDFVNTASAWASGEPVDRLGGVDGLADWAVIAGAAGPPEAAAIKARFRKDPQAADAYFEEATALRALLWRVFDAAGRSERADGADLRRLRDFTRRARDAQELRQTEEGFAETWRADAPEHEVLLSSIALAAERLLTGGPLDRLHSCGGADCEWMFLDLSRNASRRWCSMATCGNSAKVKKFRRRSSRADQ